MVTQSIAEFRDTGKICKKLIFMVTGVGEIFHGTHFRFFFNHKNRLSKINVKKPEWRKALPRLLSPVKSVTPCPPPPHTHSSPLAGHSRAGITQVLCPPEDLPWGPRRSRCARCFTVLFGSCTQSSELLVSFSKMKMTMIFDTETERDWLTCHRSPRTELGLEPDLSPIWRHSRDSPAGPC